MRDFVPEALAPGPNSAGLERVNSKFYIGHRSARWRESDLIWKLPAPQCTEGYLYLLFEFQSKNDWWMPLRTQVYQGLLWQQVVDELNLQTGAQLPPLLLIVLYNGKPRWKPPTNIRELIALSPASPLWPSQPRIRYHLLDIGAFPGDALTRRTTLAALLFRLEQRPPRHELERLFGEIESWFRANPGLERLQRLFAELMREAFAGEKDAKLSSPSDTRRN